MAIQAPQAAAMPLNDAMATMQQFMQPPNVQAGAGLPQTGVQTGAALPQPGTQAGSGLPQTGLPTSGQPATALPGLAGSSAANVIETRGGLDHRGLTVDGIHGAGVAKGFKISE